MQGGNEDAATQLYARYAQRLQALAHARCSPHLARCLAAELRRIPQVRVVWKVEANGVFAQIPRHAVEKIKERYFFYMWIEEECIVRWMCSFDTTEEDVKDFARVVADAVLG